MNITEIIQKAHAASTAAGWYTNLETGEYQCKTEGESFALMHSEVSEAVEGWRKNITEDSHIPEYPNVVVELADVVIRLCDWLGMHNLDELVDSLYGGGTYFSADFINDKGEIFCEMHNKLNRIKILAKQGAVEEATQYSIWLIDYIEKFVRLNYEINLYTVIVAKMKYNANRSDHKIENRKKAGGKRI